MARPRRSSLTRCIHRIIFRDDSKLVQFVRARDYRSQELDFTCRHKELRAKLLDYFLRRNKSNINQILHIFGGRFPLFNYISQICACLYACICICHCMHLILSVFSLFPSFSYLFWLLFLEMPQVCSTRRQAPQHRWGRYASPPVVSPGVLALNPYLCNPTTILASPMMVVPCPGIAIFREGVNNSLFPWV